MPLLWTFGDSVLSLPAQLFFEGLTPEQQQEIGRVLGAPPTPDAWVEIETRENIRVIRWARPDQVVAGGDCDEHA